LYALGSRIKAIGSPARFRLCREQHVNRCVTREKREKAVESSPIAASSTSEQLFDIR
jgi:hypothetical protein